MRRGRLVVVVGGVVIVLLALAFDQRLVVAASQAPARPEDPVKTIVARLDLERYKATIKGLTQFGDRLQGTDRNKAAIDWIEAQLRSYGCTPERIRYTYMPAAPAAPAAAPAAPLPRQIPSGEIRNGVGGSRLRGATSATAGNGPASPSLGAQSDPRARWAQAVPPGPRESLLHESRHSPSRRDVCIVGAHMDGRGLVRPPTRWVRHRAGDGDGAHPQRARRAE
jgi:hypothetical protein